MKVAFQRQEKMPESKDGLNILVSTIRMSEHSYLISLTGIPS